MALSAMLGFSEFRIQELAAVSKPVGLMSVCIGSTAMLRTAIMGLSAGMHPARLVQEVVNVSVYPSLLYLPAAMVHLKQLHLLKAACIFSHVIRSLALWAVGVGMAPNSEGIRHILTMHVDLLLEIALGFQDLLNLPVMAFLHALRQLGWMSIAYWREGGSLSQTVVRGLINWAVMMAMTTMMEMRMKKRYNAYCTNWTAMQHAREELAAPDPAQTPLPSPKKPARSATPEMDMGESSGRSSPAPPRRASSNGAGASLLLPEPITTAVVTQRSVDPAPSPAAMPSGQQAQTAEPGLEAPQDTCLGAAAVADELWQAEHAGAQSAPACVSPVDAPAAAEGAVPVWHGVAKKAVSTLPPMRAQNSSRHVTDWNRAEPADACGTAAYSHRDAYHGHSWLLPCETQSLLDGMLIGPVGVDDADSPWVPCLSAPTLIKPSVTTGPGKAAPTTGFSSRIAAALPAMASSSRSSTFNSSKAPSMDGFGAMGKLSGLSDLADQPELLSMSTQHSELSGGQRLVPSQHMVVQQLMRLVAAEKQQPYVSRQQQATVRVKMRGMEPQQLPSDLTMQLQSYLKERDPRLLVRGVSLRRGCVVMTLDMLLLGQDEGPIEPTGEHQLADNVLAGVSNVVQTNTAGAALPHGSSLSIQTHSQLSLNSWDTGTGSYISPSKMETCATRPSSDTHSSLTATTLTHLSEMPGSGRFLEVPDSDSINLPAVAAWGTTGNTSIGSARKLLLLHDLDATGIELTAASSSSTRSLAGMQLPPLPQIPTRHTLSPRSTLAAADPSPHPGPLLPQCYMLGANCNVHVAGPGPESVVTVQLQLIVPANSVLKGWDLEAQQPGTPLSRGPCSLSAHSLHGDASHGPPTTLLLLARTSGGPNLHLVVAQHEAVQDITLHTRHAGCISMLQLRVQVDIHVPFAGQPSDSLCLPTGVTLELWTRLHLNANHAPAMPLEVMHASVPLLVFPAPLAAAADELSHYLQSQGGVRPSHALVRTTPAALTGLATGSLACEDTHSMGPAALLDDIGTVCAFLHTTSSASRQHGSVSIVDAQYAGVAEWAEAQHRRVVYSMCEDLLIHVVKHAMPVMSDLLVATMQHTGAAFQLAETAAPQESDLSLNIHSRAPTQWLQDLAVPGTLLPRAASASDEIVHATASGNEPGPPLMTPRMSLLHAAMLSNSPAMLLKVLRWGQEHGGPGWVWQWHLQDASGCTALHLLALQPHCAAMLHVITDTLSESEQRTARDVWLHETTSVGMSPVQLYAASEYTGVHHVGRGRWAAHTQARQMLTAIPSGLPEDLPTAGDSISLPPAGDLPAMQQLPQLRQSGNVSMVEAADVHSSMSFRAIMAWVWRQKLLLQPDNPEYRAWVQQQLRSITLAWCACMAAMLVACIWRVAHQGHLLKDGLTLMLCMGGYVPLALIVRKQQDWQGWWLPICWMRAASWLLAASTHVPMNWASILNMHVEVVHEVLLVAMVEEMDVNRLVLARLGLWVAYAAAYNAVGHSHPLLRSLALNLSSMLVTLAMRAWRTHTFMQLRRPPVSPQASSYMTSSKHSSFDSIAHSDFARTSDLDMAAGYSRAAMQPSRLGPWASMSGLVQRSRVASVTSVEDRR